MTDKNRPTPALILGADVGPLGVLRALAARGIPCYVADESSDVATRSRWYRSPGRTLAETGDSAVLADYLRSLHLDRAVVFAGSDGWALALSGIPEDLRDRYMVCTSGRDVVEQLLDKDRFGALVSRLDIPHPRTMPISDPSDLDQLSDAELYGGFLKPTDSQLHRRHFKVKGTFVRSREGAMERVRQAAELGVDYVFQEWIPGPHSAAILIDGMVDRSGVIRALTARRKVREYPRRLGITSASVGIHPEDVPDAVDSVKRMLGELSYRGMFNIEFKYDARDGRHKVIEFNPRACAYTGTIASAGVELPWMAWLDAQGLTVPDAPPYPVGRYAYYEVSDAKRIIGAVRARRRPEGNVLEPWLTGDRALFWWKDPMPAFSLARRRVNRLVNRLRWATADPGSS